MHGVTRRVWQHDGCCELVIDTISIRTRPAQAFRLSVTIKSEICVLIHVHCHIPTPFGTKPAMEFETVRWDLEFV